MSSGVRELRVWQEAVTLAGDVVRVVRQHHRRETHSLTDRVMEIALSVGLHVAEGYGLHELDEQRHAYQEARLALLRLETALAVARHADLMPAGLLSELTTRASGVTRLLVGYMVYLDREIVALASGESRAAV
ncbi:MAG: four helix bundle protein, partial [Geodermatophilaceae bacterium]|nr:four helix bundle protein [Geodermatophilaceae bacterium]